MLKKILHVALDWLIPHACCACNKLANVKTSVSPYAELLDLCQECLQKVSFTNNRCFQCARHLDVSGRENIRCMQCQDFNMVIYQTIAACDYKYPINKLIYGLKFGDRKCIAKILAELLIKKISLQSIDVPEIIIPLPLHHRTSGWRGYNQSVEIVKYVSAYLGIPSVSDLCVQNKYIKEKFGFSLKGDQKNMPHSFSVNSMANEYTHVVILTDLVISGASTRALAAELAKSSIERIDLWCVCRI